MATTIFLGIFPTLGVAANADDDWIEIVSVSPTEYDFSSEITITATINYNLKSVSTGIVYLGFNLSEPDSFDIDLGDKSKQIVSQGEGTVKLSVTILPEEWDISGRADTEFMIYTNLSEYPHPNRWSPLAAFYCPFSDITGYDETGTTDLDILHNSLKKPSEKGDNDLALIAAKMSEKVYTLDSIKGYLTYDLQFDEKNIYDNNFAGMGSLAYVIATKEFDDYSLLVIIARGSTNPHELAQDAFSATDKESYNGYSVYDIIKDFRQAIVEGLENNIDVNKKYKILITGHSLGGAAANYLAARLPSKMKKNHSKDDIYCYTFGAIDSIVSDGTVSDGYENIHNITNFNDSFGPDGWPIFTAKGNTRYGKFGHIDLFYKDIDKGAFGSFENHKMYTYQQAVENNEVYYENRVCQKIVGIHCPVDVVVYANGSVVGKVTNNVIDYSNTSIPICIVGDEKYILLENDMDYDIQMSAFDDGTMSYTIADAQTGKDAKQFDNVKLTKDRELYSSIDNEQDTSQIKLFAESDDGESILEVKEDGSEFVSNEQTAIRKSTGRTNSHSQTSDEIQVILNNRKINFDAMPFIEDDRTLVPIRAITEAMGCDVTWDDVSRTAIIENEFGRVLIQIDSNVLKRTDKTEEYNNESEIESITLDTKAKIKDDRTFVPLRALSEAFGAEVLWDGKTRTVTINYDKLEIVEFVDACVESCARQNIAENERKWGSYTGPLTKEKLSKVTEIVSNTFTNSSTYVTAKIVRLDDIKKLPNIEKITLSHYGKTDIDISPLAFKRDWKEVNFYNTYINDDSVLDKINVSDSITFPNIDIYCNFSEDTNTGFKNYKQALTAYRDTIQAVDNALNAAKSQKTEYDKYKALHDYIINNMDYDYDEATNIRSKITPNTLYIGLVKGKGICYIYADIYKYLCNELGLYCETVSGDAKGILYSGDTPSWGFGHDWNIVRIEDNYYHVDVTWDYPFPGGSLRYEYFMLSDKELKSKNNHKWNTDEYPACLKSYQDGREQKNAVLSIKDKSSAEREDSDDNSYIYEYEDSYGTHIAGIPIDDIESEYTVTVYGRVICGNTMSYIPNIIDISEDLGDKLHIVFYDVDQGIKDVQQYAKNNMNNVLTVYSGGYSQMWDILSNVGISDSITFPVVVYSHNGNVVKVTTAYQEYDEINAIIQDLIREKG